MRFILILLVTVIPSFFVSAQNATQLGRVPDTASVSTNDNAIVIKDPTTGKLVRQVPFYLLFDSFGIPTVINNDNNGDVQVLNNSTNYGWYFSSLKGGTNISIVKTNDVITINSTATGGGGGSGDVTKVGTPVDNQVGVWTGDGTLEGDVDLTFDGDNLSVGGNVLLSDTSDSTQYLARGDDDGYLAVYGGSGPNFGSAISLIGEDAPLFAGDFHTIYGGGTAGSAAQDTASWIVFRREDTDTTTTVMELDWNRNLLLPNGFIDAANGFTNDTTGVGISLGASTVNLFGNATLSGDAELTGGGSITSTANGDVNIIPNGTGKVGIGAASPATLLHVSKGTAGTDTEIRVQHTDNTTATSDARLRVINGGSSGGDSVLDLTLTGERQWTVGADNTDNALKIGPSATVGTGTILTLNTTGSGMTNDTSGVGFNVNGTDTDFFGPVTMSSTLNVTGAITGDGSGLTSVIHPTGSETMSGNKTFTGQVILTDAIVIAANSAMASTNIDWTVTRNTYSATANTAFDLDAAGSAASGNHTKLVIAVDGTARDITFDSNVIDISNDQTITAGNTITLAANSNVEISLIYDGTNYRAIGLPDDTPNALESDGATGIADTEIFIGTGAGTGNYAAVSGDATLANTGALTLAANSVDSAEITSGSVDKTHLSANAQAPFIETLSAAHTLSVSATTGEGYNSIHYIDTGSFDITLPNATAGVVYNIISDAAVTVSIKPDTGDTLRLDGTALTASNEADSDGTAGHVFVISYHSADTWFVSSSGGVDGGAAD